LSAGTDPHRPGLCRVLVLRRRRPGLCPAPRRSDDAPAGGGATSRRTFPAPERQEEKEEAEAGDSLSRLPCLLVEGLPRCRLDESSTSGRVRLHRGGAPGGEEGGGDRGREALLPAAATAGRRRWTAAAHQRRCEGPGVGVPGPA